MNEEEIDIEKVYFNEVISCLGYDLDNYSTLESDMSENRNLNYGIKCIGKDENFKPKESTFIHFTSLKSLASILTEKSIRLYSANEMNDLSEINHYAKIFEIEDRTIQQFKNEVFIMSCCSSSILKTEDELTLWRLYGNDGYGCGIIFEYNEDASDTNTHRYNINYIDDKQEKFELFFHKHVEFNNKHSTCKINADKFILDLSVFHKSKHFKIEKEERLFCRKYLHEERFWDFNSKNKLVSYIKIPLDYSINKERLDYARITPKIRIKKIIFGHKVPKFNTDEEIKFLSKYFSNLNDFPAVKYSPLTFYN